MDMATLEMRVIVGQRLWWFYDRNVVALCCLLRDCCRWWAKPGRPFRAREQTRVLHFFELTWQQQQHLLRAIGDAL